MRDLGDFQTPPGLVSAILARLGPVGARWPRVLEPTCGRGNFIAGLLAQGTPPREILGFEIQPAHLAAAHDVAAAAPASTRVHLTRANLFEVDLRDSLRWQCEGPLLVIGNPPWVTSSELGVLASRNGPPRVNRAGVRGIEALTGSSNFDIAEAIWLKLLTELAEEQPTIALLCKTAVARKVLEHAARSNLPVDAAFLVRIDARLWFRAAVEACLLCITLGEPGASGPIDIVPVFADLDATEPTNCLGFARGRLVADLLEYRRLEQFDGSSPLVWRQGVKHDAAAVMELSRREDGVLINGLGEPVDVEPEHVFPLLKGGDLAREEPPRPFRWLIIPQRLLGEDTERLAADAPRLWRYLLAHSDAFEKRRSSIYRGRPRFSIFGIGAYSFSPFKVVVSGLHMNPRFHALGPERTDDGSIRPVFLDDTCYLLPTSSAEQAALLTALLNSPGSLGLCRSLTFPGTKRTITKALLQRIDLDAILASQQPHHWLDAATPDAVRLSGQGPRWPARLESLLEPDPVPT